MANIHGGDWAAYQTEYGRVPLDFSASTSPLPLPKGVQRAVIASLPEADRYPDRRCTALREALGSKLSVPSERIFCGNGAADILWRIAIGLQPKRALITAPSFGEYRAALQSAGCRIEEFPLQQGNGFRLEESFLFRITSELDLVLLCEPNNPTGITTDGALLHCILHRCRECGCLLVVDECFNAFLENPESSSLLREVEEGGLLILSAFTKFYAMAGLRLGWCICAEAEVLQKLEAAGQPWPVSSAAQAAGIAALKEAEYASTLRYLISQQRERMTSALTNLGCRVIPGEANFLLFSCADTELNRKLEPQGILIRSCADFNGLDTHWYRIAIRTEEENTRLLQAMKEVLG